MTNLNPNYSRRTFLKTLGAAAIAGPYITRGLMARSRSSTLRHATFGASGMALGDLSEIGKCPGVELVAICDVDLSRTAKALELFPKAKVYQDWRVLLDKEGKNLDSANVSTPDHMHAAIGVSAMQLGINIYCQKPLTHDVHEVRRMMKIAHHKKLVTQMGIHMHSSAPFRTAVRVLQDGAIGKVKEVHSWCPKSWGDSSPQPDRTDPVR
jgi:predicted dehydrogenase